MKINTNSPALKRARMERKRPPSAPAVNGNDETRAERLDFVRWFVEEFPEVREDTPLGAAAAGVLTQYLGRLTQTEIGVVLGLSRQRVEQIELVALRKCRLAGGARLRELAETTGTGELVSAWDSLDLHGWEW